MSYDDNELMRRFQALRGSTTDTRSQTTSSSPHTSTPVEQQQSLQTQQPPVLQPVSQSISQTRQPQQQQVEKKTKKKCRGNRKKQRYRRQLYARGLNTEEVEKLIKERFDPTHPQNEQLQQNMDTAMAEPDVHNIEVYIPLERVCSYCIEL